MRYVIEHYGETKYAIYRFPNGIEEAPFLHWSFRLPAASSGSNSSQHLSCAWYVECVSQSHLGSLDTTMPINRKLKQILLNKRRNRLNSEF